MKKIYFIGLFLISLIFISGCDNNTQANNIDTNDALNELNKSIQESVDNYNSNIKNITDDLYKSVQESMQPKTTKEDVKKEIDCPDFSSLSDRLSCDNDSCSDFAIINDNGVAKTEKYTLYPPDARPGQSYPSTMVWAPCRPGQYEGENANYFYCEGMYTIIKETDSQGNILSSREPYVTLVVSNSKIISSVCSE